MFLGRPPTLWWLLITAAGLSPMATLSITSGVKRSLGEELRVAHLLHRAVEFLDENAADDLALALRVAHALEGLEKTRAGRDGVELELEMAAEKLLHLLALVLSQQAVVDEDALELAADGLVQQAPAATDESTPPLRPSSTLPLPTCRRTASQVDSMKPCMVQFGSAPQIPRTKLLRISTPRGVCATSG